MPWIPRVVRPYAHRVDAIRARCDPLRPAREWPARRFETLKGAGALALASQPVWRAAPLTDEARDAFDRCDLEFWGVRRPGAETPFAVIVRPCRYMHERGFRGGVTVSERPERVLMTKYQSTLVATGDLVFCCGGSTSVEGLQVLCHAVDDTHIGGDPSLDFRRRPLRERPVLTDDAEALACLAP